MLKVAKREKFSEKGRELYYKLKPELNRKYEPDDVVLIEVESGDYFVGDTTIEAYKKAKKKYRSKIFFAAQVGSLSSFLK